MSSDWLTLNEEFNRKYSLLEQRYIIEENDCFREWAMKIPPLHFKPEWKVTIIPPFGGAIVRFHVEYEEKEISCYLDCYDRLGYFGGPYWEIYPYKDDVYRFALEDTDLLIEKITEELER